MQGQWRQWVTALNLDGIIRYWLGGCGVILMLHRVQAVPCAWRGNPGLWVTRERLQVIITTLRAQGYEFVTLDDALTRRTVRGQSRFACLTFDDGYRDNYEVALPVLRDLGVPATIYITTGFIDGTALTWWYGVEAIIERYSVLNLCLEDHEECWPTADPAQKRVAYQQAGQRLHTAAPSVRALAVRNLEQNYGLDFRQIGQAQMLTEPMLRELAISGLVELGAHTVSHPVLSTLPLAEARAEMMASKQALEALCGQPVRHFAYPYGDRSAVNPATQRLAQECGFMSAVLAYGGPVKPDANRYALPRLPFGGQDSVEDLRLRASGARALLDRVRHLPC